MVGTARPVLTSARAGEIPCAGGGSGCRSGLDGEGDQPLGEKVRREDCRPGEAERGPEPVPRQERIGDDEERRSCGGQQGRDVARSKRTPRRLVRHGKDHRDVKDDREAMAVRNARPEKTEEDQPERAKGDRQSGIGDEPCPRREGDDVADVRSEKAREALPETVRRQHEKDVASQGKDQSEGDGSCVTARGAARRPEGDCEDEEGRQRLEDVNEDPS
jgi:hypothetical protein